MSSTHDLSSQSDEPFLRATRPPAPEKLFPGQGAKYHGYASKRKRGQTNTTFKKRYYVLEGYGMLKYYKDTLQVLLARLACPTSCLLK
jgi:hypothetical protein